MIKSLYDISWMLFFVGTIKVSYLKSLLLAIFVTIVVYSPFLFIRGCNHLNRDYYAKLNLISIEKDSIENEWSNCTIVGSKGVVIGSGKSSQFNHLVVVFNCKTEKTIYVNVNEYSDEEVKNMIGRSCSLRAIHYNLETKEYNLELKNVDVLKGAEND
jgi:hypothetical protein